MNSVGKEWDANHLRQLLWLGTSSAKINKILANWVIEQVILKGPKVFRNKGVDYWLHYWPRTAWTSKLKHLPTLFDDNKLYLVTPADPRLAVVAPVSTITLATVGFSVPVVVKPPKETISYG